MKYSVEYCSESIHYGCAIPRVRKMVRCSACGYENFLHKVFIFISIYRKFDILFEIESRECWKTAQKIAQILFLVNHEKWAGSLYFTFHWQLKWYKIFARETISDRDTIRSPILAALIMKGFVAFWIQNSKCWGTRYSHLAISPVF